MTQAEMAELMLVAKRARLVVAKDLASAAVGSLQVQLMAEEVMLNAEIQALENYNPSLR